MAAFSKFNSFVEALAEKTHNLGSDTLKIVLTNTAPAAANTVLADITQIANGNGYTTGGAAVTISSSAQSSGLYKLIGSAASPTWTASGSMGPFRYVVLYNDTATSDELIGYWDYGAPLTLAAADTFTVSFDGSNGILQLT